MSKNIKIIPHVFHSFYLFDYFNPALKSGAPEFLYADWPIVNRIPKASIPKDGGKVKKFESEMDVRKWIEGKDDLKEEDVCENFIRISKDDFSDFRQLFHGLIKHLKIEHKFEASLKVDGKGIGSPTLTVGVAESNPNPTGDDAEGPCVDFVNGTGNKAIIPGSYSCSMSIDDDGEVSWGGGRENWDATGPGPCFGAGGRNFEADFKKCDKLTCRAGSWGGPNSCSAGCSYVEDPNLTEKDKETALDCCCPPELYDDGSAPTPSTTSSKAGGLIGVNFNDRLNFIKEMSAITLAGGSGSGGKWRDAKGYQCSRSHKKIIKGEIIQDGAKIFDQDELEKRIGGRDSKRRNIKDIEPPKKNPSEEEDAYKKDALTIQADQIFKNEWEFDKDKFKNLFSKSKKFPGNSTRINDPVFEYLIDTSRGQLKTYTYVDILAGLKKEGFLKGSKKIDSKNLGKYTMEVSSENTTYDFERDVVSYYFSLNLNYTAYIESTKEYLIFFDLNSVLDPGSLFLSWNGGDYPSGPKDEDTGNYIESVYSKFSNDIPYNDIALFSNKKNFSAEEGKDENGKIVKIKIPINFVFESSVKDLEIECFRFEKKEAEVKDNYPCVKNKGKINWNLDNVKIQIHGWWQNDFKRGTVFPEPIN